MADNGDVPLPNQLEQSSTTDGLPVSPSLGPSLRNVQLPSRPTQLQGRTVYLCALCVVVGLIAALMARVLILLILLLTNVSFHGQWSVARITGPLVHPPMWVIVVPVVGAIVIGLMARFGSRAVAGHGIPEAMEQVLVNQSRIPARLTFLKPVSAAISIGTGGPYGAEGPIIATGGALGSLLGQLLPTTAAERKILLAAGAAAGIAAAFNAPIAAVLLAIELLLFEFRPASIIPVAFACAAAAAVHIHFEGTEPFFKFVVHDLAAPTQGALAMYVLIGAITGVGAVVMTRTVYAIEHVFEHLPIHWMWHPAVGGLVVGVIGYVAPRTFGSGYFNINDLLSENLTLKAIILLGVMKFLSWTISLGSGTAGGTLAPVFTIGGTLGAVLGVAANRIWPGAGVNVGMAAMVGMVAIFAGASRALLTSVVFAAETTLQPLGVLPALAGCSAAYLVSSFLMQHSIMTEKMARQGVRVPEGYLPDFLDQILVREVMAKSLVTLRSEQTLAQVREWVHTRVAGSSHQGFPVVDGGGSLVGVVTRRDLLDDAQPASRLIAELIKRPPSVVYDDLTLRDAADHMVNHDIGRLPVVSRAEPWKLVGIITRSDLLASHRQRLSDTTKSERTLRWGDVRRGKPKAAQQA